MRSTQLSLVLTVSLMLLAVQATADVDIPEIPVRVLRAALANANNAARQPLIADAVATETVTAKEEASVNSETHVQVLPGVNVVIPVAVGQLNRLVTPFASPAVRTLNQEGLVSDTQANVVYVKPAEVDVPITLYIREEGDENLVISVTLWPQKRPARQVTFSFLPGAMPLMFRQPTAERWERSLAYAEVITEAFGLVAAGQIPPGYRMASLSESDTVEVSCRQAGLVFRFATGQQLHGGALDIIVGTVTNLSTEPIEFNERSCAGWSVAAVASWPLVLLDPGEGAELYVAIKANKQMPRAVLRPSLLGVY